MGLIRSLLKEYGLGWTCCRALYAGKLKLLCVLPAAERLFERPAAPKRCDLFAFDNAAIARFLRALPPEKQRAVLDAADAAAQGRIWGFSSVWLDYGDPIDWQRNPMTGKSADIGKKWYRIPDFDPQRGDIKLIWEASRFTHFHAFTRAYLLTEDPKYYRAFSRQLADWLQANPYPMGANYKCGQECSLRMLNALMAYGVFRAAGQTTERDGENLRELVRRCYQKVLSNFFYAYRCVKNNHTLSELCGMLAGAWCCEDGPRLQKAYRLLDKTILEQFTPDGGYVQNSFNYQRFALQLVECVFKMSGTTGLRLSREACSRIQSAAALLYQVQNPDGDLPNYGSNDGALIFPLSACGYRDYRPALNAAHALSAGRRLYGGGEQEEELLWFGGSAAPLLPPARASAAFPGAGLYVLRGADEVMMICLKNHTTRPAHMDGMHIDLWVDGVNVLCDGGTYSYAADVGKALMRTGAHNTVAVDGIEQMNEGKGFMLCDWPAVRLIRFDEAGFAGELRSRNGYRHARRVFRRQSGYHVEDEVELGRGASACRALLHTPCECEKTPEGAALIWKGKRIARILFAGECEIQKAWRSLRYYEKEEISLLSIPLPASNHRAALRWDIVLCK